MSLVARMVRFKFKDGTDEDLVNGMSMESRLTMRGAGYPKNC